MTEYTIEHENCVYPMSSSINWKKLNVSFSLQMQKSEEMSTILTLMSALPLTNMVGFNAENL